MRGAPPVLCKAQLQSATVLDSASDDLAALRARRGWGATHANQSQGAQATQARPHYKFQFIRATLQGPLVECQLPKSSYSTSPPRGVLMSHGMSAAATCGWLCSCCKSSLSILPLRSMMFAIIAIQWAPRPIRGPPVCELGLGSEPSSAGGLLRGCQTSSVLCSYWLWRSLYSYYSPCLWGRLPSRAGNPRRRAFCKLPGQAHL